MADARYHVLARRWRPATFDDVVGQEHVSRSLSNAIKQNRVHHAFLFSGPRGVGKTTIARILAKALNCKEGPTDHPCGVCTSCVGINEGSSMDVLEIDGASNNSVDQIRELRETVGYAPVDGRYRIIIIDEVHMLTKAAFNALLKTLEEPPEHVVFIFATTEANKVIPTVQSRCQRYDFHRLTVAEIRQQLVKICEGDEIEVEPEALDLLARHADGALRDGISLLDQVSSAVDGAITATATADLIGAVETSVYLDLIDSVQTTDIPAVISVVTQVQNRGRSLTAFLAGLMLHLRNLLACRVKAAAALEEFEESERNRLMDQAEKFTDRDLLRMLNLIAETELNLNVSAAPQVRVELALLKMAYLEPSVELGELMGYLERTASEKPAASPPPARREPPPNPSNRQPGGEPQRPFENERRAPQAGEQHDKPPQREKASAAVISARWQELSEVIRERGGPVWIHQVEPAGLKNGTLTLRTTQFNAQRLKNATTPVLEALATRFEGVERIEIEAHKTDESASAAPGRGSTLVNGVVKEEPVVGDLIDELGLDLIQ